MSTKNKCLPLRPDIDKLTCFLPSIGFKELSDATPEEMPCGSLVLMCDKASPTMWPAVVVEFEKDGDLLVTEQDSPGNWIDETYAKTAFHYYLYKVIT